MFDPILTILWSEPKKLKKRALFLVFSALPLQITECFDEVPRVASLAQKRYRAGKNKCARIQALRTPAGDGHPPGARRRPYLPRIFDLSSPPLG